MRQFMQRCWTKTTGRRPILRPRARLRVEALQDRVLPSVTAFVNPAQQLVINGDDHANHVAISLVDSSIHVAAGQKSFDFDNAGANIVQIVFNGKGGNDVFTNNTSIPCIVNGGNGNDLLNGGSGDDVLNGGAGNDTEHGGGGDDALIGTSGNDKLFGEDGDDFFSGGAGNDWEFGGGGDDVMVGGSGKDLLHGDAGNDYEHGGQGNDHLHGDADHDILVGAAGDDDHHGGGGDDYIDGGAGNDHLSGDDGNDIEHGGAGNDDLAGDAGDDDLSGDQGNDHLSGGAGVDHLHGGSGLDDAVGDDDDLQTEIEREGLGAQLTGASAALGFAEFYTVLHQGANFKVELDFAPANASFGVFVNGIKVGTLATDAEGEGDLALNLTSPPVQAGATVTLKNGLGAELVSGTFGLAQDDN